MALNFDPSLTPLPESESFSAANKVPADYGKIGLPSDKAPQLKGAGNAISETQIAKAFGLPVSPAVQNVTNLFISNVVKHYER